MAPSAQFIQLKERLATLKVRFLSARLDAAGQYSDEAKDFARSYRVLSHAEIEAFIRFRIDEILKNVLELWRTKKIAHAVTVSVLACWNKGWSNESTDLAPVPNKEKKKDSIPATVDSLVNRAVKEYQHNIEGINGIKASDLIQFVMPLGIDIGANEFSPAWRAEMDNFGIQRGRVAHAGEGGSLDVSPDDERRRMDTILPGLELLDSKFNALIAPLAAPPEAST